MFEIPDKPQIKIKTIQPDQRHFAVIPLKVIQYQLTAGMYKTLVTLASYCNKAGFSYVSLGKIGQDLKISTQAVHQHMKKLEKLGIVKTFKNYYPGIKGSTRRIIYNENISDNDAATIANEPKEAFNNRELRAMAKNKYAKKISELENNNQSAKLDQSMQSDNEIIASLFESVSNESELLELERAIARGESLESLKAKYIKA